MKNKIEIIFLASILFLGCFQNNSENLKPSEVEDVIALEIEKEKFYPIQIFPIDESEKDAALKMQIDKLKTAIANKDTLLLLSIMDTNIVSSHGGGEYGFDSFIAIWKNYNLWEYLDRIVKLGGVFTNEHSEFRIPYCQADSLYGYWDIEPYTGGVCTSPKGILYENPNTKSKIIDTLEYSILDAIEDTNINQKKFIKVKVIGNNKTGYLSRKDFSGLSDCMLCFEKNEKGKWVIKSFAPYD